MNTNENARENAPDQIIDLGVASLETHGGGMVPTEILGQQPGSGISED